jgi:hypothetical protein
VSPDNLSPDNSPFSNLSHDNLPPYKIVVFSVVARQIVAYSKLLQFKIAAIFSQFKIAANFLQFFRQFWSRLISIRPIFEVKILHACMLKAS